MRVTAIAFAMSFALLFTAGCQQEQNVPSTADFANEREKLAKRVASRKSKKDGAKAAKIAAGKKGKKSKKDKGNSPLGSGFAGGDSGFEYVREGKRDPFRSFTWERLEIDADTALRGPLEQFDVSQLEVVAVVWKTGSARALSYGSEWAAAHHFLLTNHPIENMSPAVPALRSSERFWPCPENGCWNIVWFGPGRLRARGACRRMSKSNTRTHLSVASALARMRRTSRFM